MCVRYRHALLHQQRDVAESAGARAGRAAAVQRGGRVPRPGARRAGAVAARTLSTTITDTVTSIKSKL